MRCLLVAALLTTLGWAEPQTVRSCDGKVEATLENGRLTVRRGARVLAQELDVDGELLCVSRRGKVAIRQNGGTVNVVGPGSTPMDLFEQGEYFRTAWFEENDTSLFVVQSDLRVLNHPLGLAGSNFSRPIPTIPLTLLGQLKNPQCPKEALVHSVGWSIPRAQLEQVRGLMPWTRMALQAYHGDRSAADALLKVPLSRYADWTKWLEAAYLGGSKVFRPALRRALGDPSWADELGDESTGPWDGVLAYGRRRAEPWLVEWAGEPGHSPFFYRNVLATLNYGEAPIDGAVLERLAGDRDEELARLALEHLLQSQDPKKNERLLRQLPTHCEAVLDYFTEATCAEVVPLALERLEDKRWGSRAHEVLKFQLRVDLGAKPEAWRKWLTMSLEERHRARLSQVGNESRLLLKAGLGQLESGDLQTRMRAVRVFSRVAELSGDGRWIFANGVFTLVGDRPEPLRAATDWRYDRESGRMMSWSMGAMSVIEIGRSQPVAMWDFEEEKLGWPTGLFDRGRLVVFQRGLAEAETGKVLWQWPAGLECAEVGRDSDLILLRAERGRLELWDYRQKRKLRTLPAGYGAVMASRDLKTLLWRTEKEILTPGGGPVYPLGALNQLSPDGQTLVMAEQDSVHFQKVGGACTSKPWDVADLFFSSNSQLLAWVREGQVEVRRADHELVAQGGEDRLHSATFDERGRWLCAGGWSESRLYELQPGRITPPPPEYQQLFMELWTGKRWKGGLTLPLTAEEYEKRRRKWRRLCQVDWVVSAQYRAPSRDPWLWQLGLIVPLLGVWWAVRRRRT